MKIVRRVLNGCGRAVIAVLDVIFFYRPGQKPTDLDAYDWPEPVSPHEAHKAFAAKMQVNTEERKRRAVRDGERFGR
ncbi:hypothetical protein [Haematobacter genomosp. 1]|nr:hypothetical protein [Haematobacter genomosp. 1]